MTLSKLLQYLVDHARALRWGACVVLAGLVVADLLVPSPYDRFPWESWGGFGAAYGLFSCVLIIAVAKALGALLLYRSENFYDD